MYTGKVKIYFQEKGFGFIRPDAPIPGATDDIFVHASKLKESGLISLEKGDRVKFDTCADRFKKGLNACNIRLRD